MWWPEQADRGTQNERAADLFRQAVSRDPDLALAHGGLARALYSRALYDSSPAGQILLQEALAEARATISLDPREATGYFAASGASLYLGDHATALEDARKTLQLNPNFAYAHYRLGQVLIFSGRPAEAIAPIERSMRLSPCDPQLPLVLETLAVAHYQARDYETAVELARSAGRAMGGAATAVLVAALARLGRLEEAADALDKAALVAPSHGRPLPAPYAEPAFRRSHTRCSYRLARDFHAVSN